MKTPYLINAQILRFLAASSVTVAHLGVSIEEREPIAGRTFHMIYPFDLGLGVDVFFIISGFIMYFLMHDRFHQPGISFKFFVRRLLRIVPLYWLTTTLMLVAILMAGNVINNNAIEPAHLVASYLFFPWPRADGEVFPLLSLGWTLNYEMFFYVVFAAALFLPRRVGIVAMVAFFTLLTAAAAIAPASWWLLKFWGYSIVFEFLLGIWLAALFVEGFRIPFPAAVGLVVLGLAGAILSNQLGFYDVLTRFFTGGLPALLIAAGFILTDNAPAKKPFTWLAMGGDASYALYLTHPFTAKAVAVAGAKIGMHPVVTILAGFIICVAVSMVVHFIFEKPVGAFLGNRIQSRATRQAALDG